MAHPRQHDQRRHPHLRAGGDAPPPGAEPTGHRLRRVRSPGASQVLPTSSTGADPRVAYEDCPSRTGQKLPLSPFQENGRGPPSSSRMVRRWTRSFSGLLLPGCPPTPSCSEAVPFCREASCRAHLAPDTLCEQCPRGQQAHRPASIQTAAPYRRLWCLEPGPRVYGSGPVGGAPSASRQHAVGLFRPDLGVRTRGGSCHRSLLQHCRWAEPDIDRALAYSDPVGTFYRYSSRVLPHTNESGRQRKR
jgi:hypothetical protein